MPQLKHREAKAKAQQQRKAKTATQKLACRASPNKSNNDGGGAQQVKADTAAQKKDMARAKKAQEKRNIQEKAVQKFKQSRGFNSLVAEKVKMALVAKATASKVDKLDHGAQVIMKGFAKTGGGAHDEEQDLIVSFMGQLTTLKLKRRSARMAASSSQR